MPGYYHNAPAYPGARHGHPGRYYQPALYRPAAAGYGTPQMYRTGMGYGGDHSTEGADQHAGKASGTSQADIVDTAVSAGDFNTLVTAVKAAGLVETLKGDGPFTVFAPTDAAFAKLPPEQLEALLSDKEALTRVLTYHVVPGKLKAADVVSETRIATVEGQSLTVEAGGSVTVDNATVIKTDIVTSNGVIHVIDSVMLPADMLSQR
jgi:uncharacterized surface protein with fasciclin (FAS1) repeats